MSDRQGSRSAPHGAAEGVPGAAVRDNSHSPINPRADPQQFGGDESDGMPNAPETSPDADNQV
jgi:hypothetical protein